MADSRKRRFDGKPNDLMTKKKFDISSVSGHRFLIPSKAAGAMIGKGGEIIKRLRSEHNCRIIVPDSQGPERLVIIDAEPSTIVGVWTDIIPSIKEYMNARDCDYKVNSTNKPIESENEIDLRMVVHESQAGAIIGKGGERIRTMIDKHSMTMIKLYQDFCPNSTDRVVRMISKLDTLMNCLENVFELLENQIIKGPRKDYNPDDFNEMMAPNYGGFVSKESRFPPRKGGLIGPGSGPEHGMNNHPNAPLGMRRGGLADNSFDGGDYMSRPSVFARVNTHNFDEGLNAVRSIMNQRNPAMGRGVTELLDGVIRMAANSDNAIHVSRVGVPKNLVFAIVGKEGRRLMELERDCNVEVEIVDDRMDGRDSIFVIRGPCDQIFKAQCAMQLCARKFADDNGF